MIEQTTIELRSLRSVGRVGLVTVDGWRLGDWAVHRSVDRADLWFITLLPLGLCLPPDFASFGRRADAIAAMGEIARLRNDWASVEQAMLTPSLRDRIKAICARHGALADAPVAIQVEADQSLTGRRTLTRPNGYVFPN